MKKYKDNFDTLVFNKEQEMVKAKDLYDQLEYDLLESKKREDNFSRQISSMQPRYQELTELNLEQEKDIESLKHDINKFKNENVLLKSQVEFLQKTNEDLDLQKHLENDQLVQENHLLSHNCKDLKSQIQEKDRIIENNHEEIRKYRKENEELKEENDEITQILADKDVQLGLQKTRADTSIQREREAIEKIDLQSRESQKFQLKYQQLERQYNSIVEAHRIESNEKHLRYEKLIDTYNLIYHLKIKIFNFLFKIKK